MEQNSTVTKVHWRREFSFQILPNISAKVSRLTSNRRAFVAGKQMTLKKLGSRIRKLSGFISVKVKSERKKKEREKNNRKKAREKQFPVLLKGALRVSKYQLKLCFAT